MNRTVDCATPTPRERGIESDHEHPPERDVQRGQRTEAGEGLERHEREQADGRQIGQRAVPANRRESTVATMLIINAMPDTVAISRCTANAPCTPCRNRPASSACPNRRSAVTVNEIRSVHVGHFRS